MKPSDDETQPDRIADRADPCLRNAGTLADAHCGPARSRGFPMISVQIAAAMMPHEAVEIVAASNRGED